MGWNQSLYACQALHEHLARVPKVLCDGKPPLGLQDHSHLHTQYVDNFVALAQEEKPVRHAVGVVRSIFDQAGMPHHGVE
eukprot:5105582-Amphidinium_carterae.1